MRAWALTLHGFASPNPGPEALGQVVDGLEALLPHGLQCQGAATARGAVQEIGHLSVETIQSRFEVFAPEVDVQGSGHVPSGELSGRAHIEYADLSPGLQQRLPLGHADFGDPGGGGYPILRRYRRVLGPGSRTSSGEDQYPDRGAQYGHNVEYTSRCRGLPAVQCYG